MRVALCSIALVAACGRNHARDDGPAAPPAPLPPLASEAGAASADGKSAAAKRAAAANSAAAAPSAAAVCTLAPVPLRRPGAKRVVAIGDVHGDLAAVRGALRAAGAIDAKDHWSGGALVVIQTGDVLDRGDDERAILDLIARLETEAAAAGGAFIALLGNHELMNAAGDMRYVTPGGWHAFDDAPAGEAKLPADIPAAARARLLALVPGGSYAHRLAQHAAILIVGDTAYSHAGIEASWTPRLDAANQEARCWLDNQGGQEPPALLTAQDSPVWSRAFGMPSVDCAALQASLTALGAKRMVVGHTVQARGITSACDGALWRIDVGMSKAYGGPIQVLEFVEGTAPKILTGAR